MNIIHKFNNDLNIELLVPSGHVYYNKFIVRNEREIGLRKICSFLFSRGYITGNIIDAGCWIGDNAAPWSKMTNNKVYAIDPSPENCGFVNLLKKINNLENLDVIESGLSKTNTTLYSIYEIEHTSFNEKMQGNHKVSSSSIDYLKRINRIENISFIHLDVEGMELDVISGSIETIKTFNPIIIFEQHIEREDYKGTSNFINSLNYNTFIINETLFECYADCRNLIAFPNKIFNEQLLNDICKYCEKDSDFLIKV